MIYFIQDELSQAIKIGYTAGDPLERTKALRTGNPGRLHLLATMDGDTYVEGELHKKFAHARLEGEWFKPIPELILLLAEAKRTNTYKREYCRKVDHDSFRGHYVQTECWKENMTPSELRIWLTLAYVMGRHGWWLPYVANSIASIEEDNGVLIVHWKQGPPPSIPMETFTQAWVVIAGGDVVRHTAPDPV